MVKNRTKVAVITRTKDRPLFLERAIKSVQNQDFSDFIQVIINDGGKLAPVNELLEKHKELTRGRIKVIHNNTSHGMEAASNKAIKSVDSDYIAIHDDDDTWHKDFLRLTADKLEETGAKGVVVRADKVTEQVSSDGQAIERIKSEVWMPDLKIINLYRQCIDNQMTPITFLYRREVLEKIGYYDESLPVLGDWDFGIRFLQKYDVELLNPGYPLAFYHHRKHVPGSSSSNSFGYGAEKHRYWSNILMNKYLREELANGSLGVGYIISQNRYMQNYISRLTHNIMPKFVASRLKKRAEK